jgi:electron transfer flavoprotein alpha subunit
MNGVLVFLEQRPRDGRPAWSRMSWEALAAGQELAAQLNQPLMAAVAGYGLEELAADVAKRALARGYTIQHELLKQYTADGFTAALDQFIRKVDPAFVVFPHTYQVRDFGPRLAARFEEALIADAIGFHVDGGKPKPDLSRRWTVRRASWRDAASTVTLRRARYPTAMPLESPRP